MRSWFPHRLVLGAALVSPALALAGTPPWSRLTPAGEIPSGRAAAAMVALDRELVVFGGYLECFDSAQFVEGCDNVWYDDTYRLELDASGKGGTWTRRDLAGPSARGYAGVARYDETMLLFGGGHFGVLLADLTVVGDLWQYFPAAAPGGERWERRVQANAGPGARMGAGVTVVGDDLYLFGGISPVLLSDPVEPGLFARHNDLWVYHLDHADPALRDHWELLVPDSLPDDTVLADGQPDLRYIPQFSASADGTRLMLFGGNELATGAQRDDLWIYDLATGVWSLHAPPPDDATSVVGRTHGGSAVWEDRFVVTMGDKDDEATECDTNEPAAGQKPTNQTWSYDAVLGSWTHLAGVDPTFGPPPPLKRIAYASRDERLFVWGGFDYRCPGGDEAGGPSWNNNVWALALDAF